MLKIKLALETSNSQHMTALSNFAAELAKAHKDDTEKPVVALGASQTATYFATTTEPLHVLEKPKTEKPKKTEAAEEKPKKAPAAEKQVAEKAPAEKIEEPKAASKITLDDVRRAVAEKKDAHFEIMKFKLKEDFGVTKTPDLKPEDYERFYNFVNSL
jgi:hypothetical protein